MSTALRRDRLPADAPAGAPALPPFWRRPRARRLFWQTLLVVLLAGAFGWLAGNVHSNLERSRLAFGFDFLDDASKFFMGPNPYGYAPGDTVLEAFLAGILNTIRVSALSIVLTTVLGTLLALMRLSRNWLVAQVAWLYVETMRNIPLLLQILFWHAILTHLLPNAREAWKPADDVYLSRKGLYLPDLVVGQGLTAALLALLVAGTAAWLLRRGAIRRRERLGHAGRLRWLGPALIVLLPPLAFLGAGGSLGLDRPVARGLGFEGGRWVSPEFVALLFALTIYQSAFAAETIRSGILGVRKGQIEAARSLGLKPSLVFRKIVMPQALRIIVPPLTSQYLSLTKQSSLAVAIGYPDVVRVSVAITSDTGRAVECIAIIMAVYLTLSLLTSLAMSVFNRRIAFVEK
ncbi:amino acid ABC transporter permease [Marinimicrococcus flavescens]|uniref:ABC transporter permease subunit n=1 Tax=Marinimicrococcus flavescens TaxID=3031815 RepID=A0AAP4D619_9PROT|nr:ABC transporter permease subunit [Marinimicrococcus flavescens]MDF1587065.1 ABC transporter permease subunit [Marinimicrococcus flavescens]